MTYYLYLIYETPIEPPFHCKIGFTRNPLRRLRELQQGNPRVLRSWDYMRRSTENFGFSFDSKASARNAEAAVHARLRKAGYGIRGDVDYESGYASEREWIAGVHPEKLWVIMVEETYANRYEKKE
jgi:hypothetical protein